MTSAVVFAMVSCSSDHDVSGLIGDSAESDLTTAALPTVNVRAFGARGDGVTDDVRAFEAALTALGPLGGTVYVPAGTYLLRPYRNGAVELLGRSNVAIVGDGFDRSILRIAPGIYAGSTHVMLLVTSSGITMRDLTLDGNRPNASYRDQQSHGVEIRNSSDLQFERVRFMRLHGDGIRMVGLYHDEGSWTERVVIKNSRFEDNGRSGVGMQRAVRQVQIANNTFDRMSDQSISSEPGGPELGNVGPRDIVMENNVIRARGNLSVALEGISPTDPARRLVFRNNRVENGDLSFRKVDDVLIESNVLIGSRSGPALQLPANVTNIQVVDNEISGEGGIEGLIQVRAEYDSRGFPANVSLRNNHVRALHPDHTAVLVRDALANVTILDNQIEGKGGRAGISFETRVRRGSPRSGFTVRGNVIRNFDRGIVFTTEGDPFRSVTIATNNLNHDQSPPTQTVGIVFSKTGPYNVFATLIGNVFGSGIKIPILLLQ